jgi:hypothetical protein
MARAENAGKIFAYRYRFSCIRCEMAYTLLLSQLSGSGRAHGERQ